jgi:hypothetical protein
MQNLKQEEHSKTCVIDLPTGHGEDAIHLDDYLADSTQRLESITELASRGEEVDRDFRDWMLTQVDFIVETIGDESLELSDEMRSNLLQLLLAIANLNEQIRHQNALSL